MCCLKDSMSSVQEEYVGIGFTSTALTQEGVPSTALTQEGVPSTGQRGSPTGLTGCSDGSHCTVLMFTAHC